MSEYAVLLCFAVFCMLLLFLLIGMNQKKIKRILYKKEEILRIYNNTIRIERDYLKCKNNGSLDEKDNLKQYFKGISVILSSYSEIDRLRFEEVSTRNAVDIIKEYQSSEENVKNLFMRYQIQINHLYQVLHPVKYKLDEFKKNVQLQILRIYVKCCIIKERRIRQREEENVFSQPIIDKRVTNYGYGNTRVMAYTYK